VTTGNLNFTESPQGLFGLSGFLVQPLDSNNHPIGPDLSVPPLLSVLLTFNFGHVTTVNRDASGNVVLDINLAGVTLNLDYNSAGQLTSASAFGFSIPVGLL
jgi:YD repeat-containing protein